MDRHRGGRVRALATALGLLALALSPLQAQQPRKGARAEAQPRRPALHMIAVGIDDYAPGPSLHGAVADVTALAAALTEFGKPLFDIDLIQDRKSTRLNSSHITISYAVFCLKKKN